MKHFTKISLNELRQLREASFDVIKEAVTAATSELAEKTGFLALKLVSVNEGTAMWLTPEGRYLCAGYSVTRDRIKFENFELMEADDSEEDGERREIAGRLLEALESEDTKTANETFSLLAERLVRRITGNKVKVHQYNPYFGHIMKMARARNKSSYNIAAKKMTTKIKRSRTFKRNEIRGLHDRLRVTADSFDAFLNAFESFVAVLPEAVKNPVKINEADLDTDVFFAKRRYAVKSGSIQALELSRIPGVTFETVIADADKHAQAWAQIKQHRLKLENEHKRVSFREKVEEIRRNTMSAEFTEAAAATRRLAIDSPELLYLRRDELTSQIAAVFESTNVKGRPEEISAKIYRELREQNRRRVSSIIEAAVPVFQPDENVPDDVDDAFVAVTDRLYSRIEDEDKKQLEQYRTMHTSIGTYIGTLRAEVAEFAADDVDRMLATEVAEQLAKHSETLLQAAESGITLSEERLSEIFDDLRAVAGRDDLTESEQQEPVEDKALVEMLEDEGYIYSEDQIEDALAVTE